MAAYNNGERASETGREEGGRANGRTEREERGADDAVERGGELKGANNQL